MFPQTALWQFLYFLQLYNSLGQNTQIFEIKITSLTCQAYRWVKKKIIQQHLAAFIYYTSSADTSTIKMSAFKAPALLVPVGPAARRKINHILLVQSSVSSVMEFWRWWILKCKIFAQESTCSKEIVSKQSCSELWFVKKCRNYTFKATFLYQNLTEFFKKKSFKNINLGDHFL